MERSQKPLRNATYRDLSGYLSGIFVVLDRMAVRQVIERLLLVEACSEQFEPQHYDAQ